MGKKYILQLTPKVKIPVAIDIDKSNPAWKFDLFINIIWLAFFILIAPLIALLPDPGLVVMMSLYILVIVLGGLFVVREIFFKQKRNLVIPHDLSILFFTTTLTSSLFITTLDDNISYNIFGGSAHRAFSGISIIALGAMYFLLVIQNTTKKNKHSYYLRAFLGSLIVAMFLNILVGHTFNSAFTNLLMILSPGSLWLALSKETKLRLMGLSLFVISIGSLIIEGDKPLIFATLMVFTVSFLLTLGLNIKSIKSQIKAVDHDLENIINKKITIVDAASKHKELSFIVISLITMIAGVIWLGGIDYAVGDIFSYLTIGSDGTMRLLLGSGLIDSVDKMGVFASILTFFGVVVLGGFILFIGSVFTKILKTLNAKQYVYYYLLTLSAIIIQFVFLPVDELVFLVFWVMVGLFSLFGTQNDKKGSIKSMVNKRKYKLFTDKEFIKANNIIPYILLITTLSALAYIVYLLDFVILNIN